MPYFNCKCGSYYLNRWRCPECKTHRWVSRYFSWVYNATLRRFQRRLWTIAEELYAAREVMPEHEEAINHVLDTAVYPCISALEGFKDTR